MCSRPRQLAPSSDQPACTATAGTAAPAPAPAPSTHSGGEPVRNSTDKARITTSPGTMNAAPPTSAPGRPRIRQAQKIASWVDAGPGSRLQAAIASSNSCASTQLAIFCAWRIRGRPGAGAAVPAVAVQAGWSLLGASWRGREHTARWVAYLLAGAAAAATTGPWLVLILLACGVIELIARRRRHHAAEGQDGGPRGIIALPVLAGGAITGGVLLSVAWVAFKVGALSYGGGFVIIPLMQSDAVNHYHWMTAAQFLNAVALGQITPGPVVQTVAVVGYAAAGLAGGILASVVAFTPSFSFVLLGAGQFDRLRGDRRARAFLGGAGPAAIGAILGSAIPLARALEQPWQYAVLGAALVLMLALRRGVVFTLVAAGAAGTLIALAGGTLPH